ncbi:hypothetical protein CANINC_001683 [Pichia inconspicua]|uniref:BAG domain-containing protein n=1 Tax=Pichia inconspicua TaxID=52247 RepID=A0A4T0X3I3_9ASCO|nr:hypothetical protein CANINC_001683 [[Candida] inconspicua]
MDSVVLYYVNALDKGVSLVSPYLNGKQLRQLDEICVWLKQHDKTVLYSTVGAVTLGTLYLLLGTKRRPRRSEKNNLSRKVKIKKEPSVKVDPIQSGKETIATTRKQLYDVYAPLVEQLEEDVASERENGLQQKPTSYKESTEYRKLFLNESLLNLLLKLDGVTPELRSERKAAVKELQNYLKRVDAIRLREAMNDNDS